MNIRGQVYKNGSAKSRVISESAIISSIYIVISIILAPISFGVIQVRVAEAMAILPIFKKRYIYSLVIGCFLTNLLGFAIGVNIVGLLDVFVGTIATAISATLTYKFRNYKIKKLPILSMLSPIVINAIFIGAEITFIMSGTLVNKILWVNMLCVGIGQFLSCVVLGLPVAVMFKNILYYKLKKCKNSDN